MKRSKGIFHMRKNIEEKKCEFLSKGKQNVGTGEVGK